MNQIQLVQMPDDQLTAYLPGGRGTRHTDQSVPHVSQVLTVGRAGRGPGWRLAHGAAADLALLQADIVEIGGEPLRLSDAFRASDGAQAVARAAYEMWLAAGSPVDPRDTRWRPGMKTAYVARPGESNHGWGGAFDFDVAALFLPGLKRGSDEALANLWTLGKARGWTPVIGDADSSANEAWHLDHLGPLAKVRELYLEHGYRRPAGYVARVGCALAGTLPREIAPNDAAYVQARLLIGGYFCGVVDGQIGPMTRAAFKAADITLTARANVPTMMAALTEAKLGEAEIALL